MHTQTSWLGLIDGFGTNCKPLRKREQAQSTLYKELQKIAHSLIHGIVPCTLPSTLVLSLSLGVKPMFLFFLIVDLNFKVLGLCSGKNPQMSYHPWAFIHNLFPAHFCCKRHLNPSIRNRASVAEGHSDPSQLTKSVVVRGKFRSFNLQLLLQGRHSNASTRKEGLLQPEF
jgi:hypothetical protein